MVSEKSETGLGSSCVLVIQVKEQPQWIEQEESLNNIEIKSETVL